MPKSTPRTRPVLPALLTSFALGVTTAEASQTAAAPPAAPPPTIAASATPSAATPAPTPVADPPLIRLQREAIAAYQQGDFVTFREASAAALALNPELPRLRYNLACGQARSGQPDAAVASLRQLAEMGVALPIAADEDLAGLRERADFAAVVAAMTALGNTPVGSSSGRIALAGTERDFVPEGVVAIPGSDELLVGSVRHRRIVRVAADGSTRDFVPSGRDGLLGVLGLQLDAVRGWLWACSSGLRETVGLPEGTLGTAAVFAFDLTSGALVDRLDLPAGRERNCNDLALLPDGRLLASDPVAVEILLLDPTSREVRVLAAGPDLRSPQAIVPAADGRTAFVSDWSRGLFLLDVASGAVRRVPAPPGATLVGIDGMVRDGNTLYAVQNGIAPNRVVAIDLGPDGAGGEVVARVRVLLANHPEFDEPTLLARRGSELVVVANSHWNRFDRAGKLPDPAGLEPPVLLRLPLATPAAPAAPGGGQ